MNLFHVCPTFSQATCGIAKYSKYLYAAIGKESPEITQSVHEGGFYALRESFLKIKPEVIHLQLEYGFCSPQRLFLLSEFCRESSAAFFVTFHTLAHVSHNGVVATRLAHTKVFKEFGSFDTIPSGIPEISSDCDVSAIRAKLADLTFEKLNSGSDKNFFIFGQAHPHKNFLRTIKLFEAHSYYNLFCFVSKPVQGSTEYYDRCKTLAGSVPNVFWVDEYLEDNEILWCARQCDRGAILFYEEYGSIGVSAAVKLLLNSGCPIYVSSTSHFSDLDPKSVQQIDRLEQAFDYGPLTSIDLDHRRAFVNSHSFQKSAQRHLELYYRRVS